MSGNTQPDGWTPQALTKTFGPYVELVIGTAGLTLRLSPGNPLDLSGLVPLHVRPTRQNADRIGFCLAQLFETIDSMRVVTPKKDTP